MADPTLGNLTGSIVFQTKDAVQEVRRFSGEIERPIGIVEQLEISLKDLKFAITAATDPKELEKLNDEFVRLEATLRRVGPLTERNLVGSQRAMNIELRSSTQGLIGLAFIMNSLSTEDLSGHFTVFRNSLVQAMNSAIGTTFAMTALKGAFAEFALPAGIVLGVVTALTGILAGFNKEAEEAKQKRLADIVKDVNKDIAGGTEEELNQMLVAARKTVAELKEDIKKTQQNPELMVKKGKGEFQTEFFELSPAQKGFIAASQKALENNDAIVKSIEDKLPGATSSYKKHLKETEDAYKDLLHRMDEVTVARSRADDKIVHDAMEKGLELVRQDMAGIEMKRKLEVEAITDKYEKQKALSRKQFDDENDKIRMLDIGQTRRDELRAMNKLALTKKLAEIDRKRMEDLAKEEEKLFQKSLQTLSDMNTLIGKILPSAASEFIDEFRKGIDIAIEIVKIINSVNQAGGFLNFFTTLIGGVISLFNPAVGIGLGILGAGVGAGTGGTGGLEAEGMRGKVAITNNVMELANQSSFNPAYNAPEGPMSNRTGTPNVHVHLHGTMDGQTFMKINGPKYEKYVNDKYV